MSLRWKLTVFYVGSTLFFLLATLFIAEMAYYRGTVFLADRTLMRTLDEAAEFLDEAPSSNRDEIRAQAENFSNENEGLFINILTRGGDVLYQTDESFPPHFLVPIETDSEKVDVRFRTIPISQGQKLRAAITPFSAVGEEELWIEFGIPLPGMKILFLGWQTYPVYIGLTIIMVLLGGTGWVIAGRGLAPVERIIAVAETVSQGGLNERIPPEDRGDEMGRLVRILNLMLQRIEESNNRLVKFSAHVSHQLKTPLTILRGEIEVALKKMPEGKDMITLLKSNLAELENLSTLVEDILSYSRVNCSPTTATVQPLDDLAKTIAQKASLLGSQKSIAIRTKIERVSAAFHRGRLEQALLNIVDNAIKHTPSNGQIYVRLTRGDRRADIEIEDTGPGMPKEAMSHILSDGGSAQSRRIGLRLAKSLIESFSGEMKISSTEKTGLKINISIPLALRRGKK